MDNVSPIPPIAMPLVERLGVVANLWAAANDATLARLGRLVVNDTAFFSRLEAPAASTTTKTLNAFATFLADPANWPDGGVPEEAKVLAHVTGVTPAEAALSAGPGDEISPPPFDSPASAAA